MGSVMATLGNVEDAIREAEEYLWVITDQHISSPYRLEREAYERGGSYRLIEPEGWAPFPQHRDDIDLEYVEALNKARTTGLLRERVLESLDFYVYITEKQVAALAFPSLEGKFDYIGFQSSDPRVHKLCRDLFGHYWDRAKPRQEFIIK